MKSKQYHKGWYGGVLAVMLLTAPLTATAEEPAAADARVAVKSVDLQEKKFYSLRKLSSHSGGEVKVQRGAESDFIPLDRSKIRVTSLAGKYRTRSETSHGVVITRPQYETEEPAAADEQATSGQEVQIASTQGGNEVLDLFAPYANLDKAAIEPPASASEEGAASSITHAWPVSLEYEQYMSSAFGIRADPFTGEPAFHAGLDIAARAGTPVLASADAVVHAATRHRQLGNYVMLRHADGSYSRYAHLKSVAVNEGDVIPQGTPIGTIGSTGRSTGAHLDYTLYHGGLAVNPLRYLDKPAEVKRLAKALD